MIFLFPRWDMLVPWRVALLDDSMFCFDSFGRPAQGTRDIKSDCTLPLWLISTLFCFSWLCFCGGIPVFEAPSFVAPSVPRVEASVQPSVPKSSFISKHHVDVLWHGISTVQKSFGGQLHSLRDPQPESRGSVNTTDKPAESLSDRKELFLREKKWEDDMLPMIPMSRKKHFHKCCLRKASMKKGSDYWYYCTPRKTVKQWKIMADQCRSDIKICLKQVIAFAPWHISVRRPGQH